MPSGPRFNFSQKKLAYGSLFVCLLLSGFLALFYFYKIIPFVFLPADLLMWAETNFVGDMIKLYNGIPFYTPPGESNSLVYTPGAPLVTFAIARALNLPMDIAVWRMIQLGFTVCAAWIATVCFRRLYGLVYMDAPLPFRKTFLVFTFLGLTLAATAPRTNPFAYCLHCDALALLVSVMTFWTMLFFLKRPNVPRTFLLSVGVVAGYLTKQVLVSWFAVILVFLILHESRNIRRLMIFAATAVILVGAAVGVCYSLWGQNFIFWTFEVTGGTRRNIGFWGPGYYLSIPRAMDHLIRAWPDISLGLGGGFLILRGRDIRRLWALWVAWIVLILFEALSSSVGWGNLYHFGPGVLIGAVWLFVGIPQFWNTPDQASEPETSLLPLARPCFAAAGIFTMFIGLSVVPSADQNAARTWKGGISPDMSRYVAEIEKEFEGIPSDRILLDVGNWIYLRHSFLARDRAVSLADQPCGKIYKNFDGVIGRIRNQVYDKILVRNFHSPFFLYDWGSWPKPTGVRAALLGSYREERVIPAVIGTAPPSILDLHVGPVSVLVPNKKETR